MMKYATKLKPYLYLGLFYGMVSFILRIIFIFHPITAVDFGAFESLKIIVLGGLTDVFVFILASSVFAIYSLFLSDSKYKNTTDILFLDFLLSRFCTLPLFQGIFLNNMEVPFRKWRWLSSD